MKRAVLLAIFSLFVLPSIAKDLQRPKLIVGIVVDQMRWDYLYRYYERYGNDGFKRMMNEGFNCQNTFINYVPSFTAPGHTCAYTGSVPAIHGIVGNDWIDNTTHKSVYCAEDNSVTPVSGSYKAGRMSPKNLLVTTVTDELRLATNMQSRVYGISIKDRGAIMPAGHLANGAYWFDDSTGNFMSSSYYGNALPAWLTRFNNKRLADSFIKQPWELLYDASTYTQSMQDVNPYEGKIPGESTSAFPHRGDGKKGYNGLRYLPAANTLLLKAARACIKGEALGQGSTTDFLCVSLSTPDYVGHVFTSNAMEAEDMYLRLDKELASFLKYLDNNVGEGNYTVFLTADHGAAHNSIYMQDKKIPAGNKGENELLKELNAFMAIHTSKKELARDITNYQVYIDKDSTVPFDYAHSIVKRTAIEWLKRQPGIAYVVDMEDNTENTTPEPVRTMITNGYYSKRSGCIQLIPEPGWYGESHTTGTTHGTWNPYDTHIPLLWYGWGIHKGETTRKTYMTDIAATLSALLHIQMPNGCVGNVIGEVVE